jgi:signal transduction histidine kinase
MRSPSDKPGKSSGTGHTGRREVIRPKQKSAVGTETKEPIAVQTHGHPAAADAAAEGAPRAATLPDSALEARVIFRAVRDARGRVGDFLIAEANEAACTYNRLSHEQLVGRRLLEIFPNSKTSGLFDMYVRILESGETLELADFSYLHEIHRETRRFDIRAVPIGDELACAWRDVTDRPVDGNNGEHSAFPAVFERRRNNHVSADTEGQIREFQALAQKLLEIREKEQQVLSRELHDNIAQVLSAATARITLARQEPIPAWLRQELLNLRDQLKEALADVRTLARDLRPSMLDHLGFAAALEKHADAFRQRTRMTLEVSLVPQAVSFLDHGGLTHLFRLAQEALQNIEEHSRAENAWIDLSENDGVMHLEIGDDGCAFTPERVAEAQRDGHLGLLGMRERAELLGGRFLLEAVPGQGTVLRITVPPPGKTRDGNTVEFQI